MKVAICGHMCVYISFLCSHKYLFFMQGTKCDVRDGDNVKNLVAFAQEQLKYIDIWVFHLHTVFHLYIEPTYQAMIMIASRFSLLHGEYFFFFLFLQVLVDSCRDCYVCI